MIASKSKLPDPVTPKGMKIIHDSDGDLGVLLEKIYQKRGIDFRLYNKATLERRLSKRLHARRVLSYLAYADVLDKDPAEYEKLLDSCTVNQTNFFRNPYVFEVLKKRLTIIVEKRVKEHSPLRIWCAGCSTGQEPYSFAMLLAEILAEKNVSVDVTIIASDIDNKALTTARAGVYSRKDTESVPEILREKYMRLEKGKYRCCSEIKQLISFEQHNMATDPPFKQIDLLVCRNVIIYFLMPLQMQVFRKFHQSLQPDGLLLLGDSEIPMREARGLFTCLDFEAKLYAKTSVRRTTR